MLCPLRCLALLFTNHENILNKSLNLGTSSASTMLAEMNVKLWVVKKMQTNVLSGDMLIQCLSGMEFSAHGSVSMGTAAD